jgi:hypothetical protein
LTGGDASVSKENSIVLLGGGGNSHFTPEELGIQGDDHTPEPDNDKDSSEHGEGLLRGSCYIPGKHEDV